MQWSQCPTGDLNRQCRGGRGGLAGTALLGQEGSGVRLKKRK